MNRIGGLVLCLTVVAGCKDKASSGGATADTGATAASATASASAAPPPSASAPPPALTSLMAFEGDIDMMATSAGSPKPPQPVDMLVKADKVRIDVIPGTQTASVLGGKAFLLLRVADKKLDVVADSRKQVVELDLSSPDTLKGLQKTGSLPGSRPTGKPEPPPKVTKTGNKEVVAGYPCSDWEVTGAKDNKKKASLCVADLPSTFFHIPLTGVPGDFSFAMDLIDGQHFPLRVVGYDDHTGAESGRLEVTKIDPHPVDASKFDIPAGYQTVDMMQMVQALSNRNIPTLPSSLPGVPGMPPGLRNRGNGPRPHY